MSSTCIPEQFKAVGVMAPAADAAGRTSRYVSLKNAHRAWVRVHINQGNAATILLSILQATTVAGAGSKVLANTVPVWANQAVAAGDTAVRQTDAVNFTTSAALAEKQVWFQIDPAALDLAGGFDCIAVSTGASNAANITAAEVIVESRYPGATPSSIAVD